MAEAAKRLMPTLKMVSEVLQHEDQTTALEMPAAPVVPQVSAPLTRATIAWPASFRPELLTCSHNGPLVAFSRSQRSGALLRELRGEVQPQSFSFGNIEHLGEVLGSHWGEDGMLLTMKSGHLAECTGMPANGVWACQQIGSKLPLGGSSLRKAVVARVPSQKQLFRAAVVFNETTEASVTLFETEGDSGVWFPTGEAHLPSFMEQAPSFTMSMDAEELVLLTEGGGVLKWAFTDAEPQVVSPPPRESMTSSVAWQTACRLNDDQLVRLAHRQIEGRAVPELFMSTGI
jgi:hypothetical protein